MRSSPLYNLTLARLLEFAREPEAVFWTFGFPLLLTVALGIAFRTQGPTVEAVAVVEGPGAAELQATLAADPRLQVQLLPEAEAARRLRSGKVILAVVAGQPLVFRLDPARPEAASFRLLVDDLVQRAAGRADPVTTTQEIVAAPGARYVDWLVPGLLGMQLMSGSLWGISLVIVQTRQRKLLKRLLATPMRRSDYLLSFLIARLVPLAVEVPLLFAFAWIAFDVRIQGSLAAVALTSLLGAWSFAGIGLLCASRAQNTETVNGLVNLVTMPMFILSGVFFSSARFPELLQPFIQLLPLTALNDGLRALVNDGAPLQAILPQLGILGAWGVVTFGAALRWFRWV